MRIQIGKGLVPQEVLGMKKRLLVTLLEVIGGGLPVVPLQQE